MEDRELLELAAKAAGYENAVWSQGEFLEIRHGFKSALYIDQLHDERGSGYWNPLTDDGDALRLAIKLGIGTYETVVGCEARKGPLIVCWEDGKSERHYRRAIVRVAARVSKSMAETNP